MGAVRNRVVHLPATALCPPSLYLPCGKYYQISMGSGSRGNETVWKPSTSNRSVIKIQVIFTITLISFQFASLVSISDSGTSILSDGCSNVIVDDARSQTYIAGGVTNSIYIMSTESDQITDSIWVGLAPYGMDISSNGSELYVALTGEQRIAVINLDNLSLVRRIPISATPYDLKSGLPGRVYVTTWGTWDYPRIVDTVNNTEICNITDIGLTPPGTSVEISQDGRTLFIGKPTSSSMIIYKFSLGDKTATYVSLTSVSSIGDMWLSSNGQELFVPVGLSNQVEILDSGNWSIRGILSAGMYESPISVTLVSEEKFALVGYSSSLISDGVAIFNVSTGTRIISYDFNEEHKKGLSLFSTYLKELGLLI